MQRKGNPHALLVEMQTCAATVENRWHFLKKWKIKLPFDPEIPLLGVYLKKHKTLIQKNTCTPIFMTVLFTIAKIWEQPKCLSVDKWIKQLWYIYTIEYYSAIKKKDVLPFVAGQIDLEIITLSEISQSVTDKYHMISLTNIYLTQTQTTVWCQPEGKGVQVGGGEQRGDKREQKETTLGDGHTMQCADDVLLSSIHETCIFFNQCHPNKPN